MGNDWKPASDQKEPERNQLKRKEKDAKKKERSKATNFTYAKSQREPDVTFSHDECANKTEIYDNLPVRKRDIFASFFVVKAFFFSFFFSVCLRPSGVKAASKDRGKDRGVARVTRVYRRVVETLLRRLRSAARKGKRAAHRSESR